MRHYSNEPLPTTPYRLGTGSPPELADMEFRVEDDFRSWPGYRHGLDLYNAGYYWEAHERWEPIWKAHPDGGPEHELLQGLIQLAASALQEFDDEHEGADRLLAKAVSHLERAHHDERPVVLGIDIPDLVRDCRQGSAPRQLTAQLRSRDMLATRSEMFAQPLATDFAERADCVLQRTPTRPDYHFGNIMWLDQPPTPEEVAFRFAALRREVAAYGPKKLFLGWEREVAHHHATAGDFGENFEYKAFSVLRLDSAPERPTPPDGFEIRPFGDDDWEGAAAIAQREGVATHGDAYVSFVNWRYDEFRKSLRVRRGHFWGAFHGIELVATLGLFEAEDYCRFQDVQTAEPFRRRGLCSALVRTALADAATRSADRPAIIVADKDSPADRLYRGIGFHEVARHCFLSRPFALG